MFSPWVGDSQEGPTITLGTSPAFAGEAQGVYATALELTPPPMAGGALGETW